PILELDRRGAQEDKAGEPLARPAEGGRYRGRIGHPARDPGPDETKRMSAVQQAHRGRPGGQFLLASRNVVIVGRRRHDGDEHGPCRIAVMAKRASAGPRACFLYVDCALGCAKKEHQWQIRKPRRHAPFWVTRAACSCCSSRKCGSVFPTMECAPSWCSISPS